MFDVYPECNGWTGYVLDRQQWLDECRPGYALCPAWHWLWTEWQTLSIVAATINLGQNIYSHSPVLAALWHRCHASAIRGATIVDLFYCEHFVNNLTTTTNDHVPFSMFIQNCSNCFWNGFNSSMLKLAFGSQNAGPIVPYFVGHTPWIVQISLGDGKTHWWFLFVSIHSKQVVTGHCCVNISRSNAWSALATNWISSCLELVEIAVFHYITGLLQKLPEHLHMSSIAKMQHHQCKHGENKMFHHRWFYQFTVELGNLMFAFIWSV